MFPVVFISILLGLAAFLLCLWQIVRKPGNLPPGPRGLPLLGYRFGPGPVHEQFAALAQKYGPVFSVRRGPKLLVVLNDSASVRQALQGQADAFSMRNAPLHIKKFLPNTNKAASIVWGNGRSWSDLRKFCLSSLRTFGMGKKSLEPKVNLEARELCDVIGKHAGQSFDPVNVLGIAPANVIMQLVAGRRYDYDDPQIHEVVEGFGKTLSVIPQSDLVQVFPSLLHLPIKRYSVFVQNIDRLNKFAAAQLENHRSSFQADNIRDLLDSYFADDVSRMYPVEEFWRVVYDLFAAGIGTTATTLSWEIVYLALHPHIQRKVQAELDAVVGQGRQPTMDDRPDLPYCDATLTEVMRIHPATPSALPHMASRTVTFGDYVIPKGTIVIPNLWAVHHDPKVWKNPDVFDPERFLVDDGHGGRVVERNDSWMPFSVGPRECPGAHLAKMEGFLFFTNLFQRFHFTFPPGQTHSLKGVHGLDSEPETYQVCATER